MTEAFRRLLWLIPVLAVGSVVMFFALSSLTTREHLPEQALFYNPSPLSAEISATRALDALREGGPEAIARINELGGAALPTIFKALPSMSVMEQRNLALALRSLKERMGLDPKRSTMAQGEVEVGEWAVADTELLFWERFRNEHGLDLRPLSTSRLVRRLADRNTRRQNADLLAVDTYALPLLVSSLGRIRDPEDIARARRLVETIAHLCGQDWTIPSNATAEEARLVATSIRNFWDAEGSKWTQLDQFSLLVARFSQTEFARWIFRTTRQVSGLDHFEVARKVLSLGQVSLPLFIFALLGMLIIGPAAAAGIKMLELRRSRWSLQTWGVRAALTILLLSLSVLVVVPQNSSRLSLSVLSLLMGSAYSTFVLHREINDRLDWRTHHVLRGRRPLARAFAVTRWIAPTIPTLTPVAVAEAALWVTCLEVGARLHGLGAESLLAIQEGNIDLLMTVCLGLGLATGISQVMADLLIQTTRWQNGDA